MNLKDLKIGVFTKVTLIFGIIFLGLGLGVMVFHLSEKVDVLKLAFYYSGFGTGVLLCFIAILDDRIRYKRDVDGNR